jgi:hypothetical protein
VAASSAVVLVAGGVWWLSLPDRTNLNEAITAIFTAVAAVAAAYAAFQSRAAAEDSRRALRLHFRPEAWLSLDTDGPPTVGSDVSMRIGFTGPQDGGIRGLKVRWTTMNGEERSRTIGAPPLNSMRLPEPVPLPGIQVVYTDGFTRTAGLLSIEVQCVDAATATTWRGLVTAPPPTGPGFAMTVDKPIHFRPADDGDPP